MGCISWADFEIVKLSVGTIERVEDFPEARKPAYKIWVNFGKDIGVKKTSAQITNLYSKEELLNKQIIGVVNFPPKQIGPTISEVLTLGVPDGQGCCFLIKPDKIVPLGGRLY